MSPFLGPSLVGVVRALAAGEKTLRVGHGVPALELTHQGDGAGAVIYDVRELWVDPRLGVASEPIGPLLRAESSQRVSTVGELVVVLAARWDASRFGSAFAPGERLTLLFDCPVESSKRLQIALRSALEVGLAAAGELARGGRLACTDPQTLTRVAHALATCGVRIHSVLAR